MVRVFDLQSDDPGIIPIQDLPTVAILAYKFIIYSLQTSKFKIQDSNLLEIYWKYISFQYKTNNFHVTVSNRATAAAVAAPT